MCGYSKSTALSYIIFNFDILYSKSVNMGGAWTSVDLQDIPLSRIPIMYSLASACDEKFWVSFIVDMEANQINPIYSDWFQGESIQANLHAERSIG